MYSHSVIISLYSRFYCSCLPLLSMNKTVHLCAAEINGKWGVHAILYWTSSDTTAQCHVSTLRFYGNHSCHNACLNTGTFRHLMLQVISRCKSLQRSTKPHLSIISYFRQRRHILDVCGWYVTFCFQSFIYRFILLYIYLTTESVR